MLTAIAVTVVVVAAAASGTRSGADRRLVEEEGPRSSSPTCSAARCRTRVTLHRHARPRGATQGHERRRRAACSAVYAKDGSTARAGDASCSRSTGATRSPSPATVRFFRPLTVGDRGDDVLQLKQILAPRATTPARWTPCSPSRRGSRSRSGRPQHHYPGRDAGHRRRPSTVSLAQCDRLHARRAVERGLIIGPSGAGAHGDRGARRTSSHRGDAHRVPRRRTSRPVGDARR